MSNSIKVYLSACCEPVSPGGTMAIGLLVQKNGATLCEYCESVLQAPENTISEAERIALIKLLEMLPGIASGKDAIIVYSGFNPFDHDDLLSELRQKFPHLYVSTFSSVEGADQLANAALTRLSY